MINVENYSQIKMPQEHSLSRRLFLKGMTCSVAAVAVGLPGIAQATVASLQQPRKLAFHNLHTNEKLALTYFEKGRYISEALQEIDFLLRDHRSSDVYAMDPNLLDFLVDLQQNLGGNRVFSVISGYRSASTNSKLNKKSNGVAKKSLHMQGKAIDIRINGVDSRVLQQAAISIKRGGVGYYQKSDFVHIDTGRVRYW